MVNQSVAYAGIFKGCLRVLSLHADRDSASAEKALMGGGGGERGEDSYTFSLPHFLFDFPDKG